RHAPGLLPPAAPLPTHPLHRLLAPHRLASAGTATLPPCAEPTSADPAPVESQPHRSIRRPFSPSRSPLQWPVCPRRSICPRSPSACARRRTPLDRPGSSPRSLHAASYLRRRAIPPLSSSARLRLY